ncbi:hypothetical protein BGX26_009438 [Mortierella sp. AD094]|nr:hypothetical protein BGX26_009438 [Mortierella sp. AD094]
MSSQERDRCNHCQSRNQDQQGDSQYRRQRQRDLLREFDQFLFEGLSVHLPEPHRQFYQYQYEGRDPDFVSPTQDHMQHQGQNPTCKGMSWSKEECDQLLECVKTQRSKTNRSEASASGIIDADGLTQGDWGGIAEALGMRRSALSCREMYRQLKKEYEQKSIARAIARG